MTHPHGALAPSQTAEQLFHTLAASLPDIIYILQLPERQIVFFNRDEFLGYSRAEIEAPGSLLHHLHPDDQAAVLASWERSLRGEDTFIEYRLRRKDGEWEWLQSRSVAVARHADGAVKQVMIVLTPITGRKQAEDALRESEARYRAVVEQTSEAIFQYDVLTRRLVDANAEFRRMLGYHADELKDLTIYDIVLAEHDDTDARIELVRQLQRYTIGERHFRRKDGSLVLVDVNASMVRYAGREMIAVVARDISERKQREAELAQQTSELSALYRASAQLMNPGEDVAAVCDQIVRALTREFAFADCGMMLVDEEAGELRRVARAGPYQVRTQAPLYLDGRGLTVAAVQLNQVVYAPDVGRDARYIPNESRTRSELVVPLRAQGRVIGVLDLQSDELNAFDARALRIITAFAERAELALANAQLVDRLNQARQAAEEANRLKSEFLANTSHELRTPLTGILGSLGLILNEDVRSPDEARQFAQIAYDSARHLLNIVNDLLDIAKIEAGKMTVRLEAVELTTLLVDIHMLMWASANSKHLALEIPLPESKIRVVADQEKLKQILINLIGNAIKFTEHGGVTVQTTVDDAARCVRVAVIDTGIGIPPEKQSQLFRPFVQAEGGTTRKYGGTGLGLSISRHLTELMGGALTLHSAGAGKGSTFTLTLPLAETIAAHR